MHRQANSTSARLFLPTYLRHPHHPSTSHPTPQLSNFGHIIADLRASAHVFLHQRRTFFTSLWAHYACRHRIL
ncbi:hypothetical protein CaCOL14_005625 [Colletotrichum acutatum]